MILTMMIAAIIVVAVIMIKIIITNIMMVDLRDNNCPGLQDDILCTIQFSSIQFLFINVLSHQPSGQEKKQHNNNNNNNNNKQRQ
jgi:hypothetical protein